MRHLRGIDGGGVGKMSKFEAFCKTLQVFQKFYLLVTGIKNRVQDKTHILLKVG